MADTDLKTWSKGVERAWKDFAKDATAVGHDVINETVDDSLDPDFAESVYQSALGEITAIESFVKTWIEDAKINKGIWTRAPEKSPKGQGVIATYEKVLVTFREMLEEVSDVKRKLAYDVAGFDSSNDRDFDPQTRSKRGYEFRLKGMGHRLVDLVASLTKRVSKVTKLVSSLPEQGERGFIPNELDVHGVKVVFDDSLNTIPKDDPERDHHPMVRESGIEAVKKAYALLKAKGLGFLWYGPIIFRPKALARKWKGETGTDYVSGAHYDIRPDQVIVVDKPSSSNVSGLARLIAHELGHRYWFKFLDLADRAEFADRFLAPGTKKQEGDDKVPSVTEYGGNNPEEDFAEVFAHYIDGDDMSQEQLERFRKHIEKHKRKVAAPKKDLGETTVTDNGVAFKTGQPVTFTFAHNNSKSTNFGKQFQQHLEPAGKYMVAVPEDTEALSGWEVGTVTFNRPLVVKFHDNDEVSYDEGNWKARLSKAFGKKGKALSQAILSAGYDAIVTVQGGETKEIIDLAPGSRKNAGAREAKPMKIDKEAVRAYCTVLAKKILKEAEKLKAEGETTFGERDVLRDTYVITDVRGDKHDTLVGVYSNPDVAPHNSFVLGGSYGRLKTTGGKGVIVTVNGTKPFDKLVLSDIEQGLYKTLSHEFVHAQEAFDSESADPRTDPAGYYNHPSEVNAWLRNVLDDLEKHEKEFAGILRKTPGEAGVREFAGKSGSWNQIQKHLSDANQVKFLTEIWSHFHKEEKSAPVDELTNALTSRFGVKAHAAIRKLDGVLSLSMLSDPKKNAKTAEAALALVCKFADKHGLTIISTPGAEFAGSKPGAVRAFLNAGFVRNQGRNKDFTISETMYRPAKGSRNSSVLLAAAPTVEDVLSRSPEDIVTFPWDQALRSQLNVFEGMAREAAEADDPGDLLASMASQLHSWIRTIEVTPFQWDYHGANVDSVKSLFVAAKDAITDGEVAHGLKLVQKAYALVFGKQSAKSANTQLPNDGYALDDVYLIPPYPYVVYFPNSTEEPATAVVDDMLRRRPQLRPFLKGIHVRNDDPVTDTVLPVYHGDEILIPRGFYDLTMDKQEETFASAVGTLVGDRWGWDNVVIAAREASIDPWDKEKLPFGFKAAFAYAFAMELLYPGYLDDQPSWQKLAKTVAHSFLTPKQAHVHEATTLTPDWAEKKFVEHTKAIWSERTWNEYLHNRIEFSKEAPAKGVLASVASNGGQRAIGDSLVRIAPKYTVRFAPRLFDLPEAQAEGIVKHEVLHLGYPRHDADFRRLAQQVGAPLTESESEGGRIRLEVKDGARYKVVDEFDTVEAAKKRYREIMNDKSHELQGKKFRISQ